MPVLNDISVAKVRYNRNFQGVVTRLVKGSYFTSEDITAAIGQPPASGSQVGALMRAMAVAGYIRRVGYRNAIRRNQHSAMIGVWERI